MQKNTKQKKDTHELNKYNNNNVECKMNYKIY